MIKASYGEMREAASKIPEAATNYSANVDKLYREVDSLSDAWKGKDNQEYATKVNSYKEDMKALGTAVEGYARFLQKAADALNTTQEDVSSAAGRL